MEKVAVYYTQKISDEKSNNYYLDIINNWCKNNNYDYDLFVDKVKSRKMINNRIELERLKKDISNKVYKKIIITDLTNISRDMNFNLDFISFVEKNNCKMFSIDGFNPHKIKKFHDEVVKKCIEEELER